KVELEQAQRQGNLEVAARIQYGELRELSRQIEDAQAKLRDLAKKGEALVKEEVTSEEIAEVVSRWTGIPVSRMLEGEREKLLKMEERLGKRVIGRTPPCAPWPTPSAAIAPASAMPTARSARSCSSAPPASARPSCPRPWPSFCSTMKTP
ncbi:MAG TPA: hypothetical protein VHY37_09635, partial [Tepidisphaeraceae bacterium]|nr:hypothetical protein [Tepidisphaeraceae bacterium]